MRYQEILEYSKCRKNRERKLEKSREKLQATIGRAMEPDKKLGLNNKIANKFV